MGGVYTNIVGATAKTYTPTAAYTGKFLKVSATGTVKYSGTVTSAATAVVTAPITAMGAITGIAKVGNVLTAGALTPAGATATYQWQSAATSTGVYADIAGETANTYTVVAGDATRFIKVVATGSGVYTGTKTSAATLTVPTLLTGIGAINGTPAVGSVLTAGALAPALIPVGTATYQWSSSATVGGVYTNIVGATAMTYTPTAAYAGKFLKVSATGTVKYSGTVTSAATGALTAPITAMGAITGTVKVGSVLTAGALTPVGATATYQWQSAATSAGVYADIAGETANTYTVVAGDATRFIKVVATGSGFYTGTKTSAATVAVAKGPLTAIAAITGTVQVGEVLTAGALTPAGATATYKWKIATAAAGAYTYIAGATNNTYTPVAGDANKFIKVEATGSGSYTGIILSAATTAVAQAPITAIGAITGTSQVCSVLTAGALTPAGATATYQWQIADTVGGVYADIAGATGNTYTPVAGDLTKFIKVEATGTGGYSGTNLSAATAAVTAAPLTAIGAITGTSRVGLVLTAGALTPDTATATYQWKIADTVGGAYADIAGATATTYTPVAGDVTKFIKVEATGTGGYSGAILSAATAEVAAAPLTAIGAITGTPQVGVVLTAGALTPAGATATYQWKSAASSAGVYADIAGATATTYTPVAGDYNRYIKVLATGTGSYSGTILSAAKGPVAKAPLTAIGAITGAPVVGQVLTAGALTPAGATASYQWKIAATAGGIYSNIVGATANTYTPVAGDLTKFIKVLATGTGSYSGSILSAETAAVSAGTVPGAPTIGTAIAGNTQVTVNFTAPVSDGGSPITLYTATSSPSGITATSTSSAITVTGLTNGVAYTFTVTATNAIGEGPASADSNAVTPVALPLTVNLGTAGNFVILGETAVTTTAGTSVVGDIGISPAAATFITGFGLIADPSNVFSTSSLVTGNIYASDYAVPTPANMGIAIGDMMTAESDAAGRAPTWPTELYAGDLSGQTLYAGVYKWSTSVNINTDVTLDAQGDPNAIWIFEIAMDLNIADGGSVPAGIKVLLAGGAQASNIFWQVGGLTGATLGTYSTFNGTILSQKQVVIKTGAVLNGRALAQTQVTLDASDINSPVPVGTDATVTSLAYTVNNVGAVGTIINVPAGVVKADFLAAITKGQVNQTWDTTGISATVITGDTLVVMAQDKVTVVTYTVTSP